MRLSVTLPTRDEIARVAALSLPPEEEAALLASMTSYSIGAARPPAPTHDGESEGDH